MLTEVSSRELTEWIVYFGIEPIAIDTKYLGQTIGINSSVLANVNRKKGTKAFKAKDFVPTFEKKKAQTTGQMLDMAKMWNTVINNEDK